MTSSSAPRSRQTKAAAAAASTERAKPDGNAKNVLDLLRIIDNGRNGENRERAGQSGHN
jgi:hypothetical protein